MSITFIDQRNFKDGKLLKEMRKIISNKNDIPSDPADIRRMISWLLPRKEEEVYMQINEKTIAEKLVSFIPREPFEDIKKRADLKDPVKNSLYFLKLYNEFFLN